MIANQPKGSLGRRETRGKGGILVGGSKEHRSACAYGPPKETSSREGKHGGDPGTPGQIRK